MKKRKYYIVIILVVISFFSLVLASCSENKVNNDETEIKENEGSKPSDDHEKEQDDNHEGDNEDENKELEPSPYYFFDEDDNRIDLRSEEQIDGFKNYEKDIYFVSNRVKELNTGDAISICGHYGVVGLNVFDTMANCLIYINALGKNSTPTLYLDSGIINEVFHFYHDNLTVYGPYANVSDESTREISKEAIFTGSVSIHGNNITIDGVCVDSLENTIIIYGKNATLRNIVGNSNE